MEAILLFEIEPRYKKDDRNDGRYVGLSVFSATTPKNNSLDKTFVFISEVSPTSFAYTHAKFERVEAVKCAV